MQITDTYGGVPMDDAAIGNTSTGVVKKVSAGLTPADATMGNPANPTNVGTAVPTAVPADATASQGYQGISSADLVNSAAPTSPTSATSATSPAASTATPTLAQSIQGGDATTGLAGTQPLVQPPTSAPTEPLDFNPSWDQPASVGATPSTAAPSTTAPSGALPAGFTQGSGADAGTFYLNGQRVQGFDGSGNVLLDGPNGTVASGVNGAGLQSFINSPTYTGQQQATMDATQLKAGQSSPDTAIAAMYNDPTYLAARAAGNNIGADGSIISPDGKTVSGPNPSLATLVNAANTSGKTVAPANTTGPTSYLQNGLQTDANGAAVSGGYNALSDLYRQLGITPGTVNPQVQALVQANPALIDTLPPDQAATLRAGLGMPGASSAAASAPALFGAPSGGASDANPSTATPAGAAAPSVGGAPSTAASGANPAGGISSMLTPSLLSQLLSQYFGLGGSNAGGGASGANPNATTAGGSASDGITTIDPANDLRSTVITDQDDPRTAGYASRVDQAASALPTNRADLASQLADQYLSKLGPTDVQAGSAVTAAPSDRLKALQAAVDAATQNLSSVDRFKLANDRFSTYSQATDPAYQASLRSATQRAAATGALSSGRLVTDYGNLDLARSRDLDAQKQSLFQQALADSVQDALSKQGALSGLEGQLSGEEANLRGEQRTDRQYSTDVATGNANRGLAARETALNAGNSMADQSIGDQRTNLATLEGLESGARATNTAQNNALRGERSYQTSQASDAIDRALQQYELQQQTQQQNFNNGLSLLGIGSAGNPSSAQIAGGSSIGAMANGIGQGDQQTIAALMQMFGKNSAGAGGSTTPQAAAASTGGFDLSDLARLFAGQQNSNAAATAGQGLDESGIAQLLASLNPSAALPGVQTTGSSN